MTATHAEIHQAFDVAVTRARAALDRIADHEATKYRGRPPAPKWSEEFRQDNELREQYWEQREEREAFDCAVLNETDKLWSAYGTSFWEVMRIGIDLRATRSVGCQLCPVAPVGHAVQRHGADRKPRLAPPRWQPRWASRIPQTRRPK